MSIKDKIYKKNFYPGKLYQYCNNRKPVVYMLRLDKLEKDDEIHICDRPLKDKEILMYIGIIKNLPIFLLCDGFFYIPSIFLQNHLNQYLKPVKQ